MKVIVCAIVEKNNRILLKKSAGGKYSFELPAGELDSIDLMEEFARKKTLEQAGLDIQTKFMMGVYQTIDGEDNLVQVIYLSHPVNPGEQKELGAGLSWVGKDEFAAVKEEEMPPNEHKSIAQYFNLIGMSNEFIKKV
ncbi:hypothetical protein HY993_02300 [Candidatus Micrarchaeota archaeon]|nr:hypothetical protein [Candidatus Micrarchaeota archaeon]